MSGPSFISEAVWSALGWSFVHTLWAGCLVFVPASLALRALKKRSPELRYLVGLSTLGLLALLPVAGFLFEYAAAAPVHAGFETHGTLGGEAARVASSSAATEGLLAPLVPLLPWFWGVGVALLALSSFGGLRRLRALRASGRPLEREALTALVDSLRERLGVARQVGIALGDQIVSPVVIGVFKPLVLLPPAMLVDCTPAQIEMVLIHELSHVRRHDNLMILVQRAVEVLLFFHPVVWYLSRRLALEREHCCDARVLREGHDRRDYAKTLLSLSQRVSPKTQAASALASQGLVERVRTILEVEDRSMKKTPSILDRLGAALALVVLLGGVAFAQERQEAKRCPHCGHAAPSKPAPKTFFVRTVDGEIVELRAPGARSAHDAVIATEAAPRSSRSGRVGATGSRYLFRGVKKGLDDVTPRGRESRVRGTVGLDDVTPKAKARGTARYFEDSRGVYHVLPRGADLPSGQSAPTRRGKRIGGVHGDPRRAPRSGDGAGSGSGRAGIGVAAPNPFKRGSASPKSSGRALGIDAGVPHRGRVMAIDAAGVPYRGRVMAVDTLPQGRSSKGRSESMDDVRRELKQAMRMLKKANKRIKELERRMNASGEAGPRPPRRRGADVKPESGTDSVRFTGPSRGPGRSGRIAKVGKNGETVIVGVEAKPGTAFDVSRGNRFLGRIRTTEGSGNARTETLAEGVELRPGDRVSIPKRRK